MRPPAHWQQFSLLTALYCAQGLPYGFFTLALPVVLREAGWSLTWIGFLQFLGLPWAIKFLWAPWLDHRGHTRAWLIALQSAACVAALLLSQTTLVPGGYLLFLVVFAFNLIAATQDIVTDGLAVRMLSGRERGMANAVQVGAYRIGMMLGGGLLLWILARTSWSFMYVCMASLLAITLLPVLGMKGLSTTVLMSKAAHSAQQPPRVMEHKNLLRWAWLHRAMSPHILMFALLIFSYRFGDQMISSLFTPFLLDQGVDKADIALMKGAVGSGASLLGAGLGGLLMLYVGRRTALLFSGLAQALSFGQYVLAACGVGGMSLLWSATISEGIFSAMASVALFSLMMDASDPHHAGTDYTLLASAAVMVTSLASVVGGVMGDYLGYAPTFILGTVLAVLGCLHVIWRIDNDVGHQRVAQAWTKVDRQ